MRLIGLLAIVWPIVGGRRSTQLSWCQPQGHELPCAPTQLITPQLQLMDAPTGGQRPLNSRSNL